MKKSLGATNILLPLPAALILCGLPAQPNVIAIAWLTIVTPQPPRIALAVDHRRYSYGLLQDYPEFTVNIPPASLTREVDYCGIASGRTTDKIADCAFTLLPGSQVAMPIIQECVLHLECRREQVLDLGSHTLFIGEILDTRVDEDKLTTDSQRLLPDVGKLDPLAYCSYIRQYWSLGENAGGAFQIGLGQKPGGKIQSHP